MSNQKKPWIKDVKFNSQDDLKNYLVDSISKVKKLRFNLKGISPLK